MAHVNLEYDGAEPVGLKIASVDTLIPNEPQPKLLDVGHPRNYIADHCRGSQGGCSEFKLMRKRLASKRTR